MTISWAQASTAIAGLVAILIGLIDVETTTRLGVDWDRGLITFGLGLLAGVTVPVATKMVSSLRQPAA